MINLEQQNNIVFGFNNKSATSILLSSLKNISYGQIEVILPDRQIFNFSGSQDGPKVSLQILDLKTFDMILEKSDIGLGESYMKGFWTADDISNLIEIAILNKHALQHAMIGQWYKIIYYKIKHWSRQNSKSGSKKNIFAHYDLGNSFYSLWLDQSMTYSSAYWGEQSNLSLTQAQENKYALVLGKLNAKPGAHILEIGCGWGGFAEYAAKRGYKITGITISEQQLKFAQQRIKNLGLQDQAEIIFKDYRDLQGKFDHVVSIEMLEAVGEAYWPGFFEKISEVLKPGGSVSIQTITIHDKEFSRYRKGTDFIQQYIFPGGMLPCEQELKTLVSKVRGKNTKIQSFGLDYARTLKAWKNSFQLCYKQISELGCSDEFIKMWDFYLEYCAGAFRSGQTNVVNLSFSINEDMN